MSDSHNPRVRSTELVPNIWMLALAWTVIVAGLLTWNVQRARNVTREIATNEARAHFDKVEALSPTSYERELLEFESDLLTGKGAWLSARSNVTHRADLKEV